MEDGQNADTPKIIMRGPAVPLFVALSFVVALGGAVYAMRSGEMRQLERERAAIYKQVYERDLTNAAMERAELRVNQAELIRQMARLAEVVRNNTVRGEDAEQRLRDLEHR